MQTCMVARAIIILSLNWVTPIVRGEFDADMNDSDSNPTTKVLGLITDLQNKMIAKGEASQKIYNEFSAFCKKRATELGVELKDDKADKKDLEASISKEVSDVQTATVVHTDETSDIVDAETQLKQAVAIRKKEAESFAAEEKELLDVIDMLKRAHAVLEKEINKGSASMLQLSSATNLVDALSAMVEASLCSTEDAHRLTALAQDAADSDESDLSAPPGYETKSGGIIATLKDLQSKAEKQLEDARTKEVAAQGNHETKKIALEKEIKYSTQDKNTAKKQKSESLEDKSIDEGDLGLTVADVKNGIKNIGDLRRVCIQKVEEFTAMAKSRDEELQALAKAKKIIEEAMSGATKRVYGDSGATSFVQAYSSTNVAKKLLISTHSSNSDRALLSIRALAKETHSHELELLASRISSELKVGSYNGEDPFAKVIGMISDMINRLEDEFADDASKNNYCEKELGASKEKQADKTRMVQQLTNKLGKMEARSTQLKAKVARLQEDLSKTNAAQVDMDKIRSDENNEYLQEKDDLTKGLEGVRTALKVLQDYYGGAEKVHMTQSSSADSVISLLQVIESDFARSLAELEGGEEVAAQDYKQQSQENELTLTRVGAEVKRYTKEYTAIDKSITDTSSDLAGTKTELDAVVNILDKLNAKCVGKPSDAERIRAEQKKQIAGLKEALRILESETAFLQKSSRRSLRGQHQHLLA